MKPLFSVITICYNVVNQIEETLKSVLSQTCDDYEYIVIDGASVDGTLDVLNKYKNRINKFISEKDNGIYSAMNKGLHLAIGNYTIFMNAGDYFYDNHVLDMVKKNMYENANFVAYYGDVIYKYDFGERYVKSFNIGRIYRGMFCSHQSIFINTNVMKSIKFNEKYKYAADYCMILNVFLGDSNFYYIKDPISKVTVQEGATYSNFKQSQREVRDIKIEAGLSKGGAILFYYVGYMKFLLHEYIKKHLPLSVKNKLLKIK